jgi:hypothetical protein
MTVGVVVSLLLGLAAVGLGVEDLRKINNLNNNVASLKADAAVPTAAMLLPVSGTTISGTVTLDASQLSQSVTSVVFVATGGTSQNAQIATAKLSLGGWSGRWNSASVSNGTYEIAAVAYNSAGRTNTSPAVSVTVKNP